MFEIVRSFKNGIAYATAYGEFEPAIFVQSFEALFKDPDFNRGMPIIFNSSATTNNGAHSAQMQTAAVSAIETIGLHNAPWPFAWVNGDAFAHLILKVIEARTMATNHGGDLNRPVLRHFMTMGEAEDWVASF